MRRVVCTRTTLSLTCEDRDVVSGRPPAQIKHNEIMYGKENTIM